MANWEDVAALALALPETAESTSYGRRAWKVRDKAFVWDRPFSKADLKRFGPGAAPEGPILAAYVDDLAEKEAVLAANPGVMFTIEHLDGFPAVLILLAEIDSAGLEAAVTDAWLARAPASLAAEFTVER